MYIICMLYVLLYVLLYVFNICFHAFTFNYPAPPSPSQHTSLGIVAYLCRQLPWVRDRLIADPRYLFKVVVEMVFDSGCATIAEVQKRGDDFWHEIDFYFSDIVVGLVMDVIIVSLLAPTAPIGKRHQSAEYSGKKGSRGVRSTCCAWRHVFEVGRIGWWWWVRGQKVCSDEVVGYFVLEFS